MAHCFVMLEINTFWKMMGGIQYVNVVRSFMLSALQVHPVVKKGHLQQKSPSVTECVFTVHVKGLWLIAHARERLINVLQGKCYLIYCTAALSKHFTW